jgi:hypothetical protein
LNAKSFELESVLLSSVLERVSIRGEARTPILPSIRTSINVSSLTNSSEDEGLELDSSLTVPDVVRSSRSEDQNEFDADVSLLVHVAVKEEKQ